MRFYHWPRRSAWIHADFVITRTALGSVTVTCPLLILIPIMPLPRSIPRLDRRRLPCGILRLSRLQLRTQQPITHLRAGKGAIEPWAPLS